MVVSPEIVIEVLDVTGRPAVVRLFAQPPGRNVAAMIALMERASIVEPVETPRVCRDPHDDKFLAASVEGGASYLATEDRDLLDMGVHRGVAIVDGATFLAILDGVDQLSTT